MKDAPKWLMTALRSVVTNVIWPTMTTLGSCRGNNISLANGRVCRPWIDQCPHQCGRSAGYRMTQLDALIQIVINYYTVFLEGQSSRLTEDSLSTTHPSARGTLSLQACVITNEHHGRGFSQQYESIHERRSRECSYN